MNRIDKIKTIMKLLGYNKSRIDDIFFLMNYSTMYKKRNCNFDYKNCKEPEFWKKRGICEDCRKLERYL